MEQKISLEKIRLQNAVRLGCSGEMLEAEVSQGGGGIVIPCEGFESKQTLAMELETMGVDFAPFFVFFYKKGTGAAESEQQGCCLPGEREAGSPEAPVFWVRTGVKPGLKSTWSLELCLLERKAFPRRTPGRQKLDLTGLPCRIEEMDRLYLCFTPGSSPVRVQFQNLRLCQEQPEYHIERRLLLDEMGQFIPKSWPGKETSVKKMVGQLQARYAREMLEKPVFYAKDWNRWGGWKEKRLCRGTGFFQTCFDGKRWWLVDPEGYAFFSVGPDCVGEDRETRADEWEHLLKYNPSPKGKYGEAVRRESWGDGQRPLFIDFPKINLMRAFGEDWREKWNDMTVRRLYGWGFNTVANWSDQEFCRRAGLPYVLALNVKYPFPSTAETIYQDFPDVFSEEYREKSRQFAGGLLPYLEDSLLIGYFMCNEPGWGFEKGLNLGLQLLKSRKKLASRRVLAEFLKERYRGEVTNFNQRWNTEFSSFEELLLPCPEDLRISEAGLNDLRDFTAVLIREYVGVPAEECRRVDEKHLNLGMRWAFIHDPLLLAGWEHFDVFSINCYKTGPRPSLHAIREAGVDKPFLIGEFHHGALDAGHTATGIRGVASQADRGKAYRYYVENAAAFPNLVGCHYFTYNDQSPLGRMDGECYNIGFVDACQKPYPDMVQAARETAARLYQVVDGQIAPTEDLPEEVPEVFL